MDYTVCVVEDEKFSRKIIIELLKKMGIAKIISSTNGEIALQKHKLQKADLIILITTNNMVTRYPAKESCHRSWALREVR